LSAITGSYTLEVYTSNDLLLASQDFRIEEFVPDRIRVNTKLDKQFLKAGETTTLSVNAMNFFGPPALIVNTKLKFKQSKNISHLTNSKNLILVSPARVAQ
jgi:Large extracellular alpha-helical protein